MNIALLFAELLAESEFWNAPECPFKASLSSADSSLVVMTGPNASGKSLLSQFLASWAHTRKILPVSISIRERTGAGLSDMSGMRRTMMFGDESKQSTGALSVGVARRGFNNVVDRKAYLLLDEPDLGLSEDYAYAFGQLIAQEHAAAREKNPDYHGLLVVTHSRCLVRGLLADGTKPSFLETGERAPECRGLDAWLTSFQPRSIEELTNLQDVALDRRRATAKLLKS